MNLKFWKKKTEVETGRDGYRFVSSSNLILLALAAILRSNDYEGTAALEAELPKRGNAETKKSKA